MSKTSPPSYSGGNRPSILDRVPAATPSPFQGEGRGEGLRVRPIARIDRAIILRPHAFPLSHFLTFPRSHFRTTRTHRPTPVRRSSLLCVSVSLG